MQLEKMTAQVRPRPPWEAVDLGFMMLQRWFRPVIGAWLLISLPVFLLINILLHAHPFLSALTFWWLLPVFDRIPLYILSRGLFAEQITIRSLLRDWAEVFLPHIIKLLTWYRFDFFRSYNLPVWQLEKLSGRARAQRARVLKKSQSSNALGLTVMCLIIELIVFLSLYGVAMMLLPKYYAVHMVDTLFHSGTVWWAGPLANAYLYISIMLVEPFYIAGGFSLYINRRTELEGWDIEIGFRQLAQRAGALIQHAAILFGCLFVLQAALFHSPPVLAADISPQSTVQKSATNNAVAKQTIDEVMKDKDFHRQRKVAGWVLKDKKKNTRQNSLKFGSLWSGLRSLGDGLAAIGQVALWLLLAVLVVTLIYFFSKWLPTAGGRDKVKRQAVAPKSLFGLDITPESLPEDVGASAMALWQAGRVIDALGLLYRGALTVLVHRDGINLRGSATEGDCMRIVAGHAEVVAKPTTEFFQLLTRQWQFAAYAHRRPNDKLMTELCESWGHYFGELK